MGTRNLTIVRLNKQVKVAQYCQWGGYPTGQGFTIADFIQKSLKLAEFKKHVSKLKWAKKAEVEKAWVDAGADSNSDTVSSDVSENFKKLHPQFSRDTGAEVLKLIQNGKVQSLKNDLSFLKDSLFCEWAYEIDLDRKVVRVFRGFQKDPKKSDGYGPAKVFKTIKFKDCTRKTMREIEKLVYKNESED